MIIKSRAATLHDVVPGTPRRCPACRHRIGRRWVAIYNGHPEAPETVSLAGWRCSNCGAFHQGGPR
jgi:DNA-directed RNA polymerase subunit RPC12/RpoP